MTILGIETATGVCGAALSVDGCVRAERWIDTPHMHSEKIITMIDSVVRSAGIEMDRCDGIAVSIGPGSFTGLRIGLSVAKGLACGLEKPVLAVSTLAALAQTGVKQCSRDSEQIVLSLIDARRDEVYCAAYVSSNGELKEVIPPCAVHLEEIESLLPPSMTPVVVVGDGMKKFRQHVAGLNMKDGSRYRFPSHGEDVQCMPAAVALIGERMLRNGEVSDVAMLEPMYIKEFHTLVKTQHGEIHS